MTTSLVAGAFTPSVLLSLARRTGRLAEHGLVVEERPVPSSPAQFRALLEGALDIAFTSPDNVLAYRFSPHNPLGSVADVSIVSCIDRGMGLGLYGRPGLVGAASLRGARVGVDVPTSGFALALYALMDSLGVAREEYELVALGSTPRRLAALRAGECDATMLNAGNELFAEQAGCVRLASVADVCSPYLGTVLGIAGSKHLEGAHRLSAALQATARDIVSGTLDEVVREEAGAVLDMPEALASRYLERLKDVREGLIVDDAADMEALATVASLRARYMPEIVDGKEVLAGALDPVAGLLAPPRTPR